MTKEIDEFNALSLRKLILNITRIFLLAGLVSAIVMASIQISKKSKKIISFVQMHFLPQFSPPVIEWNDANLEETTLPLNQPDPEECDTLIFIKPTVEPLVEKIVEKTQNVEETPLRTDNYVVNVQKTELNPANDGYKSIPYASNYVDNV